MEFLEVQPDNCRIPLKGKELPEYVKPHVKRVMFFDPTEVYKRIADKLDPYKRHQNIKVHNTFPKKENGLCGCGCGKELTGRRTRWVTEECGLFAYYVNNIIKGDSDLVRRLILRYYFDGSEFCTECGVNWEGKIQIDHTVAVMNGGGGCWLSNYNPLCSDCHKDKTKLDFKSKKTK